MNRRTGAALGKLEHIAQSIDDILTTRQGSRFTEFGNMIVNGLVNGQMSGLGQIKGAVSALGDSTIGWFREKLGIHSPSRVFAELGGFTSEGLAMGLDDGAKAPLEGKSQSLPATNLSHGACATCM